jgi:NAD(P)H-dependent flavin oxidoreductase YrpB (nitropropane dioxygenase family)
VNCGLGMLVPWRADLDTVRRHIQETRGLTRRPFGVNLNLEFPQDERLAVCLEEGVPVISFFWRDPSPLVPRAKAGGAMVLHSVGSVAEARRAVESGVDVVVAQGWEAGGHVRGTVATLPLVPSVIDAVAPTPVVAAGGIADGRGLAAVLALGAGAAWIGTRFLASTEAAIHPHYRERVLQASAADTVYLENLFDRGWENATASRAAQSHCRTMGSRRTPSLRPASRRGRGDRPIERRSSGGALPVLHSWRRHGRRDRRTAMWVGQSVGLVSKLQPAAVIVREIVDEAETILRRLGR